MKYILKEVKKPQEFYIKACFLKKGKLLSGLTGCVKSKWNRQYGIGKTTTPKIGMLFVFNTDKNARWWASGTLEGKLFKCRVGKVYKLPNLYIPAQHNSYADLWKEAKTLKRSDKPSGCPIPGTFLTDEVTLIEEIT